MICVILFYCSVVVSEACAMINMIYYLLWPDKHYVKNWKFMFCSKEDEQYILGDWNNILRNIISACIVGTTMRNHVSERKAVKYSMTRSQAYMYVIVTRFDASHLSLDLWAYSGGIQFVLGRRP